MITSLLNLGIIKTEKCTYRADETSSLQDLRVYVAYNEKEKAMSNVLG